MMSAAATAPDPDAKDAEADLIDQVRAALAAGTTLAIRGGGSKAFYGNPTSADGVIEVAAHRGIIAYEPTELAITLRAGTPLAAVEALLAAQGQQLPFEPPRFGPGTTIGGAVAAGLSGPRRPYAGSLRDALLGVRLLNGRGQALGFGGRVMKNVAGYDLSRLQAGALGVLGVLLEVSLKVAPIAPERLTLVQQQTLDGALALLTRWAARALPITATAWWDGQLALRIEGGAEGLAETRRIVGGEPLDGADAHWADLRDQRHAFFADPAPLWRLSVRPATAAAEAPGEQLIEWGGALRWLRTQASAERIRALARGAGGHATLFRSGTGAVPPDGVFTPLGPVPQRLHRNLKQAFDPAGLFNPGRLYPGL